MPVVRTPRHLEGGHVLRRSRGTVNGDRPFGAVIALENERTVLKYHALVRLLFARGRLIHAEHTVGIALRGCGDFLPYHAEPGLLVTDHPFGARFRLHYIVAHGIGRARSGLCKVGYAPVVRNRPDFGRKVRKSHSFRTGKIGDNALSDFLILVLIAHIDVERRNLAVEREIGNRIDVFKGCDRVGHIRYKHSIVGTLRIQGTGVGIVELHHHVFHLCADGRIDERGIADRISLQFAGNIDVLHGPEKIFRKQSASDGRRGIEIRIGKRKIFDDTVRADGAEDPARAVKHAVRERIASAVEYPLESFAAGPSGAEGRGDGRLAEVDVVSENKVSRVCLRHRVSAPRKRGQILDVVGGREDFCDKERIRAHNPVGELNFHILLAEGHALGVRGENIAVQLRLERLAARADLDLPIKTGHSQFGERNRKRFCGQVHISKPLLCRQDRLKCLDRHRRLHRRAVADKGRGDYRSPGFFAGSHASAVRIHCRRFGIGGFPGDARGRLLFAVDAQRESERLLGDFARVQCGERKPDILLIDDEINFVLDRHGNGRLEKFPLIGEFCRHRGGTYRKSLDLSVLSHRGDCRV